MKKGFTLIETMVAVTIIALAIAGPLTAASRSVVAGQLSRDQLIASYLAQESIEYVRAMRDNEFLALYPPDTDTAAAAWDNFLNGSGGGSITTCKSTICTLDVNENLAGQEMNAGLVPCSGGICTPLYLANGIYTQDGSGPGTVEVTPFTRAITFAALSSNEEQVTSTVSWSFHGAPYSVTVTDHLTPWQ